MLISSHSVCPISAILLENLPSWFTIPINLCSSVNECGAENLLIADLLDGSARTPLASISCPKYLINFLLNLNFSGLKVTLKVCSQFRVVENL